ncbi:MAG: alpha/beta hydrolase [Acidimicrobiales bacterium]
MTFEQAEEALLARYGVSAEKRSVELGGRTARVLVVGEGPPVVMANGAGTPAAMFAPLMAELEGYTLYAVDWPGHGLSDPDPTFASDLRENSVRFLVEVLDALGLDHPAVVANSFGSWASTWLALRHPARIRAMVHLGCPAIALDTSAPLPMRLLSMWFPGRMMMKIQPPSARQVRQLSKMVGEHPLEPDIGDLLLATERQPQFEASFVAIINALIRLRGSRPEQRIRLHHLAEVTQPTLLVFGNKDPFGAASVGERIAEAMPNARLHVVEAGHAPWLRHHQAIGKLANEFLSTAGVS